MILNHSPHDLQVLCSLCESVVSSSRFEQRAHKLLRLVMPRMPPSSYVCGGFWSKAIPVKSDFLELVLLGVCQDFPKHLQLRPLYAQ